MQTLRSCRVAPKASAKQPVAVAYRPASRRSCVVALASATAVETVTTLAPVVHVLSPATFDTFIQQNADKLVIVDFYTDWCGPCKMMAPELDKMAAANDPAKVLFAKINCGADDTSKRLAMAQEIRALPTFKLFKAGQEVDKMTGAKAKVLADMVEKHA